MQDTSQTLSPLVPLSYQLVFLDVSVDPQPSVSDLSPSMFPYAAVAEQ